MKPENIYLVRRGDADFVKVVDFGISKAVKQGGDEGDEGYRLTHTGLLLGTPLYMSPEQARGEEDLDHRCDIWALGVLLYECLTGEVPFRANNYLGIIAQVLNHTPQPPSQLRPELGIPDAVEAVVMRAMAKDRDRRYQTMAELERDLDRLLAGDQNVGFEPVTSDVNTRGASGPQRWPFAVAAAVVLAGGVALALGRPVSSPPPAVPPTLIAPAAPEPKPAPALAPAATVAPAERPPVAPPAPVRKTRVRPERPATRAEPANPAAQDSVKRGVLPSGSKEAYPDK